MEAPSRSGPGLINFDDSSQSKERDLNAQKRNIHSRIEGLRQQAKHFWDTGNDSSEINSINLEIEKLESELLSIDDTITELKHDQRLTTQITRTTQSVLNPSMDHVEEAILEKVTEYHREVTSSLQDFKTTLIPRDKGEVISPRTLPPSPCYLNAFIERKEIQEKLRERLLNSTETLTSITPFQGFGGCGKTYLARTIVHDDEVQRHYSQIFWFNRCDDPEQLSGQLHLLAQELGLVDKAATAQEAIDKFLAYLERQEKPYLLVFDNADCLDLIKPFIPEKGGQVLVTTRNRNWENKVELELFTPEESSLLIHKVLGEDTDAEALSEAMGCHPLGLMQACALIKQEGYPVSEFLKRLNSQKSAFLKPNQDLSEKGLPSSVYALWEVTFERLKKKCPEALDLLDRLAFLAPDEIPHRLISKLAPSEVAVQTLIDYALIQILEGERYVLHRLLQMVTHLKWRQVENLQKALEALTEAYIENPTTDQIKDNRSLLPHGQILTQSCQAQTSLDTGLEAALATTCRVVGLILEKAGQYRESKSYLETALACSEKVFGKKSSQTGRSLSDLGNILLFLGDATGAKEAFEKALEILEKTLGKDHPDVAVSLNGLGNAYNRKGESDKAIKYLKESLEIREKTLGKDHPDVATSLNNLGNAYDSKGEFDKAIEYYQEALGKDHPDVAIFINNLGLTYNRKGEFDKAIKYYQEALEIREKTLGKDHPDVAIFLNNLGTAYYSKWEFDKTIKYYQEALEIFEKTLGKDHPDVAASLNTLGTAYYSKGEFDKAIKYYQEALEIREKTLGKDHPDVATSLNSLGTAYYSKGESDKAIKYFQEALEIREKTLGKDHPDTVRVWKNLERAKNKDKCVLL